MFHIHKRWKRLTPSYCDVKNKIMQSRVCEKCWYIKIRYTSNVWYNVAYKQIDIIKESILPSTTTHD